MIRLLLVLPFVSGVGLVEAEPALSLIQARAGRVRTVSLDLPPPQNPETLSLQKFQEIVRENPVKFYLYDPAQYEPRFQSGELSQCDRKGADYMFLEQLVGHKNRVMNPKEAEVYVVPCLFETYRRCTTTNHAEKPPEALVTIKQAKVKKISQSSSFVRTFKENPHPEDFEDVPWVKAFDYNTEKCLRDVMSTDIFADQKNGGDKHVWLVADWTMNFGRTVESALFKNMTIGRIEVVDRESSLTSNRPTAVEQSKCSFVVPYASDLAYHEDWRTSPDFQAWMDRKHTVTFRFEDRPYVLFCKGDPCPGASDATPLRKQSLALMDKMKDKAAIAMERVPMDQFISEMHDAKFCLVIRGDTPSSHSFYDALSASCVPIVVSDKWEAVAGPFAYGRHGVLSGGFEHSNYVLQFSEHRWMNDLDGVVAEIEALLADERKANLLFDTMKYHREALLWSMPGNSVTDFALQSARSCITS